MQVDYKIAEATSLSELSKIVSNLVKNCGFEAVGPLFIHTEDRTAPVGVFAGTKPTSYSQVCIKYTKADQ